MSAEGTVEISQVPVDIDPQAVGTLKNPLKEDFVHAFNGKDIVVPAEGNIVKPLPTIMHLAKHLAEKIIRDEHRGIIAKIKDEKKLDSETRKAIPNLKGRTWDLMKTLVETDEPIFEKKEVEEHYTK